MFAEILRSINIRAICLILMISLTLALYLIELDRSNEELLTVVFFDVGQGDATYIRTPDGVEVLIDGGHDNTILRKLSKQMGFFDRTIDVLIGTHQDADHVGGLSDVLNRYQVNTIITTENTGESAAASAYLDNMAAEKAEVIIARAGQIIELGDYATLHILFPDRDPSMFESNTASIVTQLRYGDIEFMLTGDAPKSIEDYLVTKYGNALKSDVLKLGHHGSDTSTSDLFLNTIAPIYSVTSAGEDNRYGHPHHEVIERVQTRNISMLGTLGQGDVGFYSDGVTVWHE